MLHLKDLYLFTLYIQIVYGLIHIIMFIDQRVCTIQYTHGRPEGGKTGHLLPPWNSNRMLNILTFILIYKHFIDIFTLVCGVGI
jgi:hypothetical protein